MPKWAIISQVWGAILKRGKEKGRKRKGKRRGKGRERKGKRRERVVILLSSFKPILFCL
jgi:hypothetical protein